jgi:hypothetical protein
MRIFRAMASFENAQKFLRADNDLLPTFLWDLIFRHCRACGDTVANGISRNQQYALHPFPSPQFLTTRQSVGDGATQQKRNTCGKIASVLGRARTKAVARQLRSCTFRSASGIHRKRSETRFCSTLIGG